MGSLTSRRGPTWARPAPYVSPDAMSPERDSPDRETKAMNTDHVTTPATDDADSSTVQRTIAELTCDLTVVSHHVRDLARWVPEHATGHLDAALLSIDAAWTAFTPSTAPAPPQAGRARCEPTERVDPTAQGARPAPPNRRRRASRSSARCSLRACSSPLAVRSSCGDRVLGAGLAAVGDVAAVKVVEQLQDSPLCHGPDPRRTRPPHDEGLIEEFSRFVRPR